MQDDDVIINWLTSYDKRWSLDKDSLRKSIELGKKKLEDGNLSRRKRQSVRVDIETFKRFLEDDYEYGNSSVYKLTVPNNIDKLKEHILLKMYKQYNVIGDDVIRWIIALNDYNIFKTERKISKVTELSVDNQIEIMLMNYEKNSPKFLDVAKKILLDENNKRIQMVDEDAYCYHNSITCDYYILFNIFDAPCVFNHEVEHAIEGMIGYSTHIIYDELGAILNEMLFNEELYKINGYLEKGDYDFRIDETSYLIKTVSNYFKVLLYFKSKNFDVSTGEFIDTFIKYCKLKENNVLDFLKEDIASNDMINNIGYLLSFLKALELREKFINSNDGFCLFENYLKRKRFEFRLPPDGVKLYSRYIDEVKSRVRKR